MIIRISLLLFILFISVFFIKYADAHDRVQMLIDQIDVINTRLSETPALPDNIIADILVLQTSLAELKAQVVSLTASDQLAAIEALATQVDTIADEVNSIPGLQEQLLAQRVKIEALEQRSSGSIIRTTATPPRRFHHMPSGTLVPSDVVLKQTNFIDVEFTIDELVVDEPMVILSKGLSVQNDQHGFVLMVDIDRRLKFVDFYSETVGDIVLGTVSTGLPLTLQGTVPEETTVTLDLDKPESETITVVMAVHDPDSDSEGQLVINGKSPIALFGSLATTANDQKDATVKYATPTSDWMDGANTLLFRHTSTLGYVIKEITAVLNQSMEQPNIELKGQRQFEAGIQHRVQIVFGRAITSLFLDGVEVANTPRTIPADEAGLPVTIGALCEQQEGDLCSNIKYPFKGQVSADFYQNRVTFVVQ